MEPKVKVNIPGKGSLQGTTLLDAITGTAKCHRFSRVPYALPPTGPRRWQKPEPLPNHYSYSAAIYTRPSAICPQLRGTAGRELAGQDEDCLQANVYVPLGKPPKNGWPVFFYIHGGFLQFGSNNSDDPSALLSETDVKCIFISPAYRLGILGFLASREICQGVSASANFGFWDLRTALEWTYDNIEHFGGDRDNITVGGLSAGAYAAFHLLAFDVGPNAKRQIIRRVIHWSNGCGVQPKEIPEAQQQFDDLTRALRIPQTWNGQRKLHALRAKSSDELIQAAGNIRQKFFRPVTDGEFLCETLFQDIYTGKFGKRLHDLGIQTLIGDLTQEFHLYKNAFPPNSYDDLVDRLSWDYPRNIAIAICKPFKPTASSLNRTDEGWKNIFGRIYADMQIHSTLRGYLHCIHPALPLSHIYRYRIDWRTASVDKRLPKALGATHGTDLSIWLFGNGESLIDSEKTLIREFLKPVAAFLIGEQVRWETSSLDEVRCITAEGKVEIKKDDGFEEKLRLWHVIKEATRFPGGRSNL